MKFKKYQKGGKSPQEIMAEARRNQAIWRQQEQARAISQDSQETAAREIALDAQQTAAREIYLDSLRTVAREQGGLGRTRVVNEPKAEPKTFDQAFAEAQKAGLKVFDWFDPKIGKTRKIKVELANEPTSKNKSANTNKSENNTSTAQQTASDPLFYIRGNEKAPEVKRDESFYIKRNEEQQPAQIPAPPRQEGSRAHGFGKTGWYPSTSSFFDVKTTRGTGKYGWTMDDGTFLRHGLENLIINAPGLPTINRTIVTSRDPKRKAPYTIRDIINEDTTYYNSRGKQVKLQPKFVSDLNDRFQIRWTEGLTAEEKERNRNLAIPQGEGLPEYQQGGQIPSYQQGGGILDRIKQKLSERFTDPNRYQVNADTWTTYEEKEPFIGRPSETRSITGPNRQTSKMVIRRPGTERADTTFYSPGGAKNPDLYPPFTPQDIREGNRKGKGNESFMQKFTSPDYFPHLRKYQQGGPVEETNDEMVILDFAIRYLKGLGVNEEELQSGIPEQWLEDEEFLSKINAFANDPDAMLAYQEDPEATIQNYLSAEQELTDDQIEFAKKGAKLKQLKSKQKRCKCGCLMESKEKGGKLISKCSCGCKI